MARKDSWFKWVINRWFAGTRGLSFAGKGLYADLITLWRDGQVVPSDPHVIAGMLGVRDYRSVKRPLAELISRRKVRVDDDGNLYNTSVDDDIAEREEQRRARIEPATEPPRESGDQQRLPFRPHLVHDSVGNRGRTTGEPAETGDCSADDDGLSADCSPSRARNPLKRNETRAQSENPESLDSQNVVEAPSLDAARARADPSAPKKARQ